MAKGTSRRLPKTNVSFGKDAEVICKKEGSTHEGERGKIVSGEANKEGEFEVRFEKEGAQAEHEFIHGNDLGDVDETESTDNTIVINADSLAKLAKLNDTDGGDYFPGIRIDISSAGIVGLMFCHFSYEEVFYRDNSRVSNSITKKSALPVHDDLRKAFSYLPLHLAVICEELSEEDITDTQIEDLSFLERREELNLLSDSEKKLISIYDRYRVEKFSIKGSDDSEGVVLTGYKRLTTFDEVQLVTPKRNWNGDYQFINELRNAINNCIAEVKAYHNGKKAPDVQASLPFDSAPESGTDPLTK